MQRAAVRLEADLEVTTLAGPSVTGCSDGRKPASVTLSR
jgi:hypothetical protein